MPKRFTPEVVVLIIALIGQTVVVFLAEEPMFRLGFSLACLVLIVWSSVRLGPIIRATESQKDVVHKRRFSELRSNVGKLLDEIRRLNWLVVDEKHGVRSREQTESYRRQVEDRLTELLGQIRSSVGVESPEDDTDVDSGGEPAG